MLFSELLVASACLLGSARAQSSTDSPDPPAPTPTGIDTFANVTVYQPDSPSTRLFYARTESLPNNTVLAAWNDPAQANNTISIYRSKDSGFSWYSFGTATSSEEGRQLLQPHLLYLNSSFNGDSGAVLLAVNAVDAKSTNIEVYASYDQGESFELASQIVSGGPLTANGTTAVSNPFLVQQLVLLHIKANRRRKHGCADCDPAASLLRSTIRSRVVPSTLKRSSSKLQPATTTAGPRQSTLSRRSLAMTSQEWRRRPR